VRATTPLPSPYRLSVDQYEALVESGIFAERDKLQLINGILMSKVTQGNDHIVVDDLCRDALGAVVPAGLRSDSSHQEIPEVAHAHEA
jgi:hypothetical protein